MTNLPGIDLDWSLHDLRPSGSTYWIELRPGRYRLSDAHWQPGGIVVDPDVFQILDAVIAAEEPTFDPFGPTEVPKAAGQRIIASMREAAVALRNGNRDDAIGILRLGSRVVGAGVNTDWSRLLQTGGPDAIRFLTDLATVWDGWYGSDDVVSILGL